jgi:hypothetical protein
MTPREPPADDLTPAELGLARHLALLREAPSTGGATLVARVVRAARWQEAVREPLALVGNVAGILADAVKLVLGPVEQPTSPTEPGNGPVQGGP